jgi:hypothetical protein
VHKLIKNFWKKFRKDEFVYKKQIFKKTCVQHVKLKKGSSFACIHRCIKALNGSLSHLILCEKFSAQPLIISLGSHGEISSLSRAADVLKCIFTTPLSSGSQLQINKVDNKLAGRCKNKCRKKQNVSLFPFFYLLLH